MDAILTGKNDQGKDEYTWVCKTKVPAGYKMRFLFRLYWEF